MRTLSILTALLFLAGCGAFESQLTASPEPGVAEPTRMAAQAQQRRVCTNRSDVLGHLAKKYSEAPVALGLASNGGVIEVLSSNSGKTWTIIFTMPNGISCMLRMGVPGRAGPGELANVRAFPPITSASAL